MRTPPPPDGFAEFVAGRSVALLRAAWLLTGDSGRSEDLLRALAKLRTDPHLRLARAASATSTGGHDDRDASRTAA